MYSAKHELLLVCLRQENDQYKAAALAEFSYRDWEFVLTQARHQGVAALLSWQLSKLQQRLNIPDPILTELRDIRLCVASRNTLLLHELDEILPAFQEAGISTIVLKGAHIAQAVYADISLRRMADLDLLVKPSALSQASNILLANGYVPYRRFEVEEVVKEHHHLPPFMKRGGVMVELHWSIALLNTPVQVDLEGLWDRAQPVTYVHSSGLALSPEDLLLHLCLHPCQEQLRFGLQPVCDVAYTLAHYQSVLDWEVLVRRAEQWRVSRWLYLMLYLARTLLNAPVPSEMLTRLHPSDFEDSIATLAKERVLGYVPPRLHPDLVALWGKKPLREKLSAILKDIFPPRVFISRYYNVPLESWRLYLGYFRRIKELFQRYSHQLWQMARGDKASLSYAERTNALNNWLSTF